MTADEAAMFDPGAFALYRTSPSRAVCPVGERLSDAQHRMVAALALIGSRHAGESVAAITHAVMIRLAMAKLLGIDDESWRLPVGRGSLTEVHMTHGELRFAGLPEGGQADQMPAGAARLPA
jgi:broad specificity phosphatase PhoE